MAKKILVLGGTGAIGVYLVNELLKLGYEVFVTTRSKVSSNHTRLKYIIGNAKNGDFISSLRRFGEFDSLVDFMVYNTAEFRLNVNSLLELSNQYVFVSTYRVFSDSAGSIITENSPRLLDSINDKEYLLTDEYALSKARQEDILKKEFSNDRWTIVRPSITYSNTRFQFGALEANTILPRAKNNLAIPIPQDMLNKKTTMTWAGDVARMISCLVANEKAINDDFNVLTNEARTWAEVAEFYKENINLKVFPVSQDVYGGIGLNKWQIKYDRMLDRVCSNEKILSFTGMKNNEIMPLRIGLKRELEASLEQQKNFSTINRINGRVDKAIGIFRLPYTSSVRYFITYLIGRFG